MFALAEQDVDATRGGSGRAGAVGPVVFIDLDTVLLAVHQGRRGIELGLQSDLDEALGRLSEVAGQIVIMVEPPPVEPRHGLETSRRIELLQVGLGQIGEQLLIVTCPHGEDGSCTCAKPEVGLIQVAIEQYDLPHRGGWYIGGDQAGVTAGRNAGLHTIRIGPAGEDHLSAVHRPDYEARDLLDAANHVMLEALA